MFVENNKSDSRKSFVGATYPKGLEFRGYFPFLRNIYHLKELSIPYLTRKISQILD